MARKVRPLSSVSNTEAGAIDGILEQLPYPKGHEAYRRYDVKTQRIDGGMHLAICNYTLKPGFADPVRDEGEGSNLSTIELYTTKPVRF